MSGYWLKIENYDPNSFEKKEVKVRYSMPGLGFSCEKIVDSDMANLLKIAIEEGKNQARKEIREALGIHGNH